MAVAARPAKRIRATRRSVTFVRPQLMHHEALAIIDVLRAALAERGESTEAIYARAGLDEIVRVANEYALGGTP